MSWLHKLNETYDACRGNEPEGAEKLLPVSHAYQQAHIEVTIDSSGQFESARFIGKVETAIPATEASAGRVGTKPPPHPLCDKVQYCAGDYPEFGGAKPSFFTEYQEQLANWCQSPFVHRKAQAVLNYISSNSLTADLVKERVLHVGPDNMLLTRWTDPSDTPEIFKVLTAKAGERDQGDALIRWQVRDPDQLPSEVWLDESLQDSWARFDASTKSAKGLCLVTGELQANLAASHPKRIRHAGDGAKLISANDSSGYTFRGRFTDDTGFQASGVGYEVTQKAHNALRWLIHRQAYRQGDQVIVCWAVGGTPVPDPFLSTLDLIDEPGEIESAPQLELHADAGQALAQRLRQKLRGYGAQLGATDDVVVMGLDSATPGRMAITYYRELKGSELLERVESWHIRHAWFQNFSKEKRFVGAPAPHDIAECAYGRRLDEKLKKAVVERLLPSIIDGQPLPRDLVSSVIRRACNRVGLDHWEWEKCLGIACGLYRGFCNREDYQMDLEADRCSRDYLYGRLLALAERIESLALHVGGEKRDTAATKLMQRFADRPASTWRTIELALAPAKSRLRAKRGGAMHELDKLHDEIVASFRGDDFMDNKALTGEFLLGYHCQRRALMQPKATESDTPQESTDD
ncbi:type I-C CRISPR-associated protein Cas8c/Csd1 [Aquabacterium sp. A08]|uniref:type I-C CRISPR-associated protein Cas8c/Csd1 n=1 Tax=Aquabacterium sp. A08 TaxID=2718532 RepID=UPI00141EC425|nr:type I-C CRISPR-associated protein Cas8c/Csd1 [Aquabacterium sp. A08]NIC40823.1 type I-C CRISPR-associated protein Cas8c/Csd1 [Aquabacterium sp. A08]